MHYAGSEISLQATLSAQSALSEPPPQPHHPIMCVPPNRLFLYEDGRFACEHAEVPADDRRLQYCIDHSIAVLLLEVAHDRFCT